MQIYEIIYDKCDANQISILSDIKCDSMKTFAGNQSNLNLAAIQYGAAQYSSRYNANASRTVTIVTEDIVICG